MKRTSAKASAKVRVVFQSARQMRAVAEALIPELSHPAGEKARATIVTRGKALDLQFEARDSTALRAILSSYLRMLAASLNVSKSLMQLEQISELRETDKSRNR